MEDITRGKLTVNGVQLHYAHRGDGPHTLLCISGALVLAEFSCKPQFEYFGRKGSGFKIVTFDLRGYGNSRPAERHNAATFHSADAKDAHALMQALGFESYSVLGWCHGGSVAMVLAVMFPKAVEKLILIASQSFLSQEDIDNFEKTRLVSTWPPHLKEIMAQFYSDELFQELWTKLLDIFAEIRAKYNGNICREKLSQIGCPTLILHGARDPMVSPSHAQYLKDGIAGSRLVVMEEGKHWLQGKHSKEVNALVETFVL